MNHADCRSTAAHRPTRSEEEGEFQWSAQDQVRTVRWYPAPSRETGRSFRPFRASRSENFQSNFPESGSNCWSSTNCSTGFSQTWREEEAISCCLWRIRFSKLRSKVNPKELLANCFQFKFEWQDTSQITAELMDIFEQMTLNMNRKRFRLSSDADDRFQCDNSEFSNSWLFTLLTRLHSYLESCCLYELKSTMKAQVALVLLLYCIFANNSHIVKQMSAQKRFWTRTSCIVKSSFNYLIHSCSQCHGQFCSFKNEREII
jgi:hypothetical protein